MDVMIMIVRAHDAHSAMDPRFGRRHDEQRRWRGADLGEMPLTARSMPEPELRLDLVAFAAASRHWRPACSRSSGVAAVGDPVRAADLLVRSEAKLREQGPRDERRMKRFGVSC